jgi:PIN domain nuclease of toxin-antitoxin system
VKLLLDTHIWIWSLLEPERLTDPVRSALEASENEIWLSPINTWELLILIEKGRVVVDGDPARWVEGVLKTTPFREAPITHEVAVQSRRLGLPHQDPADRFLAASAKVHGLTLVTGDVRLTASTEFAVLANR